MERQLEIKRAESLKGAAVLIQKNIRGYLAREKYRRLRRSAVTIQKYWKGYRQRNRFQKVRNGVVKTQALIRGKIERKRFTKRKAEFRRRVEAEKVAKERARQRAEREAQLQAQAKKSAAIASAKSNGVQQLEIPQELSFIFSKIDSYNPPHTEKNMMKVLGGVTGTLPQISLPHDLHQYEFSKFSSVYFKGKTFSLHCILSNVMAYIDLNFRDHNFDQGKASIDGSLFSKSKLI